MITKDLGAVSAYAYAVEQGYSGTEDEFAQLMADYASVGQSAAQSAEQASASATSASGSAATATQAAQTATSKASEAVTAAGTATTKASEASTSADTASTAAQTATDKASIATTAASTATTKASEAAASETAALSAKTDAESARDAAAQSASEAAESARTLTIDATLTQSGQAADAKATGNAITKLTGGIIEDISAIFTTGKIYYQYNGNIFEGTKANNEAAVIDASEGHYYIVYTGVPYSADYYGIIFTNDSGAVLAQYGQTTGTASVPMLFGCVAPQGTTKAYINNRDLSIEPYVKESINIRFIDDEFSTLLDNSSIIEYLEFGTKAVEQPNEEIGTYKGFIGSTGKINTTTYDVWKLHKYAAVSGKTYKLIGEDVNIYYDTYAIATFSTSDFDGTEQVTGSTIIIPSGSGATDTDYDVTFIAPSDGYIYISQYGSLNTCALFDVDEYSSLINRLTNTTNQSIKMQIFGDSMSDDIWRVTWNNFVPYFIPQRSWNIVNCAVGGSCIGHGKSVLEGGRYQDLDYNFVHDLITNPNVFETDNDIVVMFVGTNDYSYPTDRPLGQWGDDTVDTFYGAARLICQYVSEHTDALFIVCIPLPRYSQSDSERQVNADGEPINQDGKTLRDYCDALVRTCNFYHIPVIDLNYNIGWNRHNILNFARDGLHPNEKGAQIVGAYVSSIIKQHLGI